MMSPDSEKAQNTADVILAGEVQRLLLPKSSPQRSWCSVAAKNRMANVLGGDFYDFIELHDGCQAVFVGDVTGHGLHATVVMALAYGFVHRAVQNKCDPRATVAELNAFLRTFARRSAQLDHFFSATMFFGVIDPHSLRMRYVNAGHPAGLVQREHKLMKLAATGHPLGFFDEDEFREETFQFCQKDRFLLYTDGLVDASNPHGEMFGLARLEDTFRRLGEDDVVFLEKIFADVKDFMAGQSPLDDCTAIMMDFH